MAVVSGEIATGVGEVTVEGSLASECYEVGKVVRERHRGERGEVRRGGRQVRVMYGLIAAGDVHHVRFSMWDPAVEEQLEP